MGTYRTSAVLSNQLKSLRYAQIPQGALSGPEYRNIYAYLLSAARKLPASI